jgi:eukaryotic-like serine/threonine-protein kinase
MAVGAADRVIANRYALKTRLGPSELGRVWHAQDTLLGREVVVREILFPPWLAGPERRATQASVLRQAGAVARLNHPGVVTVFDVVADHHGIFIVTELVQAPTLADLVRTEGPLPPRRVAEIGAEVASVLETAHSAGIVHRDIKPANVMVRRDGGVRLAGFGVTPLQGVPQLTAAALALGSPAYMAPEQARGRPSGPAADMWALGATMFFAVEGEPPFDKGTLVRTLAAVVDEDPRPMLRAGPLEALLTALLAKNPEDRLPASKVRIWLRWLVNVAHAPPPSDFLSTQAPGGAIPRSPTRSPSSRPQPAKTPVAPMATGGRSPLEAPASDPARAPTVEPSTGTAAAQPPRGPVLPPAPPVRRPIRGWTAGVLALLVMGGLLLAWLPSALRPDPAGENRAAPPATSASARVESDEDRAASARGMRSGGTGTTRSSPSTSREPATTRPAPSTRKDPATTQAATPSTRVASPGGLPAGWRVFTNRAGNNRVGVPPGFRARTRQRYNAAVLEEQGGARRVFTVRSQNPSAPLPKASRDYRAWARRNLAGFREVRYVEDQTYAGHRPAVVFEYQAVRDGRRVHVRHINVKGRTWGYNVEFILPAGQWDASQRLARQFEHAFQPLG